MSTFSPVCLVESGVHPGLSFVFCPAAFLFARYGLAEVRDCSICPRVLLLISKGLDSCKVLGGDHKTPD